jgi:iron complex transport system substrate-binding protein
MSTRSRARRPLAVLAALTLAVVLSACSGSSSDDDETTGEGDTTEATDAPEGSEAEGTFPATVAHRHGETVVEAMPERVVTVGYSDQDAVLAFGVTPVAVTDWYGDHEHGVWEWAQDELGDGEPEVLNQGEFTGTADYDLERIRLLEPDLIIGLYTDMDEQQYADLTDIAPTIAPSADHPEFGMPWQEVTRMTGAALGQPERAEELIEEVDAQLAAAAEEHPEFAGQEGLVAEAFEPGTSFVRSKGDPRTQIIEALGFVLPDDLAELAGDQDGAQVSDEQMDLLDRDLVLWNVGHDDTLRAQIEAKPLYETLQVVQDGRSVFVEDPIVAGALTWGTVLSIPYAIDELVPLLAAAYAE